MTEAVAKRQGRPVRAQTVRQVEAGVARSEVRIGGRVLSARQITVLQGIADGKRNEELAEEFGITMPGVQKYVGQIMEITGTTSRAAAVAFALRCGLIK